MIRCFIPLAVAIVLAVGCHKTAETSVEGGGDPNTTYTIKIREEQKGDKVRVVMNSYGTTTTTVNGKTNTEQDAEKFDYIEEILEMPADATLPTKVKRTYTTAERNEKGGGMRPLSFAGKTVVIEKKGNTYVATADGKALSGKDAAYLTKSYTNSDRPKTEDLLPKKSVKLNEAWTVDPACLKKVSGGLKLDSDMEKSSITGKLTKVYSKNGKQWGAVEFHIFFVPKQQNGQGPGGEINFDLTMDAPIDGSSYEGTEKSKGKVVLSFSNKGQSGHVVIEGGEEQTVTPAK